MVRVFIRTVRVILDAKYEMANLRKVMENQCKHLTGAQHNELLKLLHRLEELFDGTLGTWKTNTVDFELKEDVNTICLQPYRVPKVHEEMFKKEVERLFLLGFLEVENDSEWGAPSFMQPKPKSN